MIPLFSALKQDDNSPIDQAPFFHLQIHAHIPYISYNRRKGISMWLTKVQIQISPEHHFPGNTNLIISQSIAKFLAIHQPTIWISYGSAIETGNLLFRKGNSTKLYISSRLANRLALSSQSSIHARFDARSLRLQIGPLVGILLNFDAQTNQDQPFGPLTRFLEECVLTGIKQGICVSIFTPEQIDLQKRRIEGWIWEKNQWQKKSLPFPDVIYNRITSRKVEHSPTIQQKLNRLRNEFHISIFNEKFLDKWEVHQILQQDPQVRQHLPETIPFHLNHLKRMATKYPILYLKPTNGSLGSGIIRLIRHGKKWLYQSVNPNGTTFTQNTTYTEIRRILARRIGRQPYLIQQGLNLLKYDGRPIDFRVLVQKNHKGEWIVTSVVGRIANNENIVSNLARGGTLRKGSDLLKDLGNVPKPTHSQLKWKAIEIAASFEKIAEGHYAELGIDLAIDQQGKIWLLEINSKPSKTDDTITNPNLAIRPSVNRLMEYILYLTGFNKTNSTRTARIKGRKS